MYKAIFFDLDGTLIKGYMDNKSQPYGAVIPLDGRRDRLHALIGQGIFIGIATNQAGVAFGIISEDDVMRKVQRVREMFGLGDIPVQVCFAHPKALDDRYRHPAELARRKPNAGMIRELCDWYQCSVSEALFVGDRPEDEEAARNAGVAFQWANNFF